ncbi:hypothetical protein [Mycobacterium sp. IDR2000157661]|uniref:hypothetical protein n=1 Tax=Mycobacterium sp. IDR2000157661 TaxID=2867005 RepID=UPI001EE9D47B|nr:hypothetical protein [Mycobacterium sp. IDR2000157661]ULE34373.1 hypothetical protein K3G64_06975 [Mycobacterium sp. IDR2000157661]
MSTTEVSVLLEGSELPQCVTCCGPITSLHSTYNTNGDYVFSRHVIECENGHMQVLVAPVERLDDEWRDLLSASEE